MATVPPSVESVRHVDFFVQKETGKLRQFGPLRETLQSILNLLQSYRVILGCNGSIAKHSEIPLFTSRIEARINESFSRPRPHIVELPDGRCGRHPSWTDLIREAFSESQFELLDDNAYRYCIGGILVEMSRPDRDMLCSGLLQKLLRGRTDPEDLQKECDSRYQVISDLIRLNEDALEVTRNIQDVLCALQVENNETDDKGATEPIAAVSPVQRPIEDISINYPMNSADTVNVERSPLLRQQDETNHVVNTPWSGDGDNISSPTRVISPWRSSEKRQLKAFLSTRHHLRWSEIAQEYEQMFHKGRSQSSIVSQARQLGLLVPRKSKRSRMSWRHPDA